MSNTKYPVALRERATRLAVDARRDPETRIGAITRIATRRGVHKEALRTWVRQAEAGEVPVAGEDVESRLRALEKQNRALRRSHEIWESAAAFSAAQFDRPSR